MKEPGVPVQRNFTTDKKDNDFPQNSGKNDVERDVFRECFDKFGQEPICSLKIYIDAGR